MNFRKNYIITLLMFYAGFFCGAQVTYEDVFPDLEFEFPVELQNASDGTNRFFVVEQPGKIKVFPNSSSVTSAQVSTFLDITGKVYYSSGQEIGLLGLAFHPNFGQNGFFYVYYTRRNSNNNTEMVLERYQAQDPKSNTANPASGLVLFSFEKVQSYSNHNGGKIAFGTDGYLYISIGDGGGAGDPHKNGQNLNTAFASLLRIDVDMDGNNPVETNPDLPNGNYEIPSDNPRVGLEGLDELYAWGLRNTWKFSFDPPTNRLWGADVGQNRFEEINLIQRGGNYGWNLYEATSVEDQSTTLATSPDVKPIYFYGRSDGDVCVTGGYVYRGISQNPSLQGKYIFGDYASGRVWSLNYDNGSSPTTSELLFRTNGLYISSFGLDELGELYFCNYGSDAKIYKIIGGNNGSSTITVNGVGRWATLDQGSDGTVNCIATDNNGAIYAGGDFSEIGGIKANNIAVYSIENGWQPYGNGTNGPVNTIAVTDVGALYIGGNFTDVNGVAAVNVAYYDGNNWTSLGTGTDGPVSKISLDSKGSAYVGGAFTNAGGSLVNNIAKWSNSSWTALVDASTTEIGTNNEVRSIAVDANDQLYVGGNFDAAGGRPAARIATWSGTNWGSLGDGTSGFVQAILVTQDYIYAGGNFAIAGNQTVNRIARWDKTNENWQSLGHGVSGNVNSLSYDGSYLYAGGNFETAANMENKDLLVHNIARWSNAKGWEALGIKTSVGIDGQPNTSVFLNKNSQLYVGGNFTKAGQITASNIGIWSDVDCTEFIPEYQVDGTWKSGETALSVSKGTLVVMGIVQKDVVFTITLPDSTEVSGTYNLGEVDTTDTGIYTFTSETGCTTTLTLTVTEEEELDTDNDGVPDRIDECPNTPVGTVVDVRGCGETETPPVLGDFTIETADTCDGTQNGKIVIDASISDQYVASLTSEVFNESYEFTKTLEIPNLPMGNYNLCFSRKAYPTLKKCYEENIEILPPLEVNTIKNKNEVQLTMSGAPTYSINVNGVISNTSEQETTIPLTESSTHILITTEIECQGVFEETFVLDEDFLLYPNPFDNHIKIQLPTTINGTLEASIFSSSGMLVNQGTYEVINGILTIDTTKLTTSALYYLRLDTLEKSIAFKVLKR